MRAINRVPIQNESSVPVCNSISKMHASLFLCLLLSGIQLSRGGFWDGVKKVGQWVKNNCSGSLGFPSGVSVSCKFNGRKRDLDEKTRRKLDTACDEIEGNPLAQDGGFSEELVESIFKESDDNNDGVLNDNEYKQFENMLGVYYYCVDKDD